MLPNIDIQLRQALNSRKGEWPALAKRSGVSYSWLCMFARGEIPNPGYATMTKLSVAMNDGVKPTDGLGDASKARAA